MGIESKETRRHLREAFPVQCEQCKGSGYVVVQSAGPLPPIDATAPVVFVNETTKRCDKCHGRGKV